MEMVFLGLSERHWQELQVHFSPGAGYIYETLSAAQHKCKVVD
jgi:hypothetical protein